NQFGCTVVFIEIFAVHTGHLAEQPLVRLISGRRRIPRLAVWRHIGLAWFGVLHPLRTRRTHVDAGVMHYSPVAGTNLSVDHPSIFGEPAWYDEIGVFHGSDRGHGIGFRDFEDDIGLNVPAFMPLNWGGFVLG